MTDAPNYFPIIPIDRRLADSTEQLGARPKFWFVQGNRKMLFKAEFRGTGEDWAEKISCHLCELLALPHVHYEMATEFEGDQFIHPGVICENLTPSPQALFLGNELLLARDPSYPASVTAKYKVRKHTVSAVLDILHLLDPPFQVSNLPPDIVSAVDVFIGYVLLDAWIANPDRHHGNWAAIAGKGLSLAPTFDHGASLARLLTDEDRRERLETKDRNRSVQVYVQKARSAFYEDESNPKPLSTLECYRRFANFSPIAAKSWENRLSSITAEAMSAIIERIPKQRMSDISKKFTLELLIENKRRILDHTSL